MKNNKKQWMCRFFLPFLLSSFQLHSNGIISIDDEKIFFFGSHNNFNERKDAECDEKKEISKGKMKNFFPLHEEKNRKKMREIQ